MSEFSFQTLPPKRMADAAKTEEKKEEAPKPFAGFSFTVGDTPNPFLAGPNTALSQKLDRRRYRHGRTACTAASLRPGFVAPTVVWHVSCHILLLPPGFGVLPLFV